MPSLRTLTAKLALDNLDIRGDLVPLLKQAAETNIDSKFKKDEDVPLSKLPGDLQENAKNPPPKVKKLKEQMQAKSSSLDRKTLEQLVDMAAESMELDESKAKITSGVTREANTFSRAVSQALAVWVQKYKPEDGSSVSDLMNAEAAYLVFMTLEEHGVGIWDGRWDRFYKDTKKLESYLKRSLAREHTALQTAINDAAWETAGDKE